MNLRWLIGRLRAMGPGEIVWRVKEQVSRRYARNRLEGTERFQDEHKEAPALPFIRDALRFSDAEDRAVIKAAAERIRAGEFTALGVNWPRRDPDNLFPRGIWQLDPVTQKSWPANTYCFDIDYRHLREIGDVKYVWEFNRLHYLQVLAADYALDADASKLEVIETALLRWAEENPPFRGVHYAEILNVAMRAISILVVSTLCGTHLSKRAIGTLRMLLHAHLFWIERFPSLHSSANNHLIAELAAEYLIAVAFGDDAHADRRSKSWTALMAEAVKQFHSDGVNVEQSPSYGAFSAEFLLLASMVGRAVGDDVPSAVMDRLCRFSEQIGWLANAVGRTPSIGDNDEGKVLSLCQFEADYPFSVASALGGAFGWTVPSSATEPPSLRRAFFGKATHGEGAPEGVMTFGDGGLSVMRGTANGRSYILTFDHGPLGYLSIAAHGHADALSITLDVDDAPLLVDPGTYLYHSGGAWRDWLRGTAAHNTLNIEGRNQSTIMGAFNWAEHAQASLLKAARTDDRHILASHDGYSAAFGVRHERRVSCKDGGISIVDRLSPLFPRPVEIVFQAASGTSIHVEKDSVLLSRSQEPTARLHFSIPGEISVAEGGEPGEGGWVSEKFGQKSPAPRIAWRGSLPQEGLETVIELIDRQAVR